ncbi:hypothetical protein Pmar_PMAR002756, partial [Perkinsus marinus ATCC 50983]
MPSLPIFIDTQSTLPPPRRRISKGGLVPREELEEVKEQAERAFQELRQQADEDIRHLQLEDRFTICPSLGSTGACGFGLFDGTAGDFAAENVKRLVFGHLVHTRGWNEFETLEKDANESRSKRKWMREKCCLESAMNDMFVRSDVELMHLCGAEGIHYAASTGVCAVITKEHLAVGHL